MIRILQGDCRSVLRTLPDESVHMCVTSPPYYGLRDYQTAKWEGGDAACNHLGPPMRTNNKPTNGTGNFHGGTTRANEPMGKECSHCGARRIDSQIGLEPTPDAYVAELVAVFREVRRVLRKDGTCWINLGDSYAGGGRGGGADGSKQQTNVGSLLAPKGTYGLKAKDLIGIPWSVAFALRADGWWLRQDIIWSKLNPMPESVTDRCCKSHEYIFLLTKSKSYYFDSEAIAEDAAENLQRMLPATAPGPVQQERPAARRIDREMQGVPFGRSKGLGSQIQSIGKGEGSRSSLLLFGDRTGEQEGIQKRIFSHARAAGSLQVGRTHSRKGSAIQSTPQALRQHREGKDGQGKSGPPLFRERARAVHKTEDRDQEEAPTYGDGMFPDNRAVERDQGQTSSPVRVLREGREAAGEGSYTATREGWTSHGREHRASLQDVQREEGRQTSKRTKRSVWHVATAPFPEAHFATFPPALIEPCILAGCPAKCCAKCGAPWVREVEHPDFSQQPKRQTAKDVRSDRTSAGQAWQEWRNTNPSKTLGFSPSCSCDAGTIAGTVLDPFGGAGTTGLVADRLQRNAILIELNAEYAAMAERRIFQDAPLFAEAAE